MLALSDMTTITPSTKLRGEVSLLHLGRLAYPAALRLMERLAEARRRDKGPEQHPGQGGRPGEVDPAREHA